MLYLIAERKMDDLSHTAVSNMTWKFLDKRLMHGDSNVELQTCVYNVSDNFLECWFKADSTNIKSDVKYNVVFRWYDVDKFFTEDPEKSKYSVVEKMLRNIIHKCDIRLYSDDPSFSMQGCWEGLDANDLSIYEFPGPNGNGVWDTRHMGSGGLNNKNIHLTKHIAQIISQIETFVPNMAQKLRVAYKEGYDHE